MTGEPMGEFDLEAVVLDVVRKQTGQPAAGPRSRLEEDLGLSENGRKALFAFVVEAFTARGLNLPARGFYQSHFLACATPGEVQDAVRAALSGAKRKPAAAGTASATPPPAAARLSTHAAAPGRAGAGNASIKKARPRGATSARKGKPKAKAPVKPKARAKKTPARRRGGH